MRNFFKKLGNVIFHLVLILGLLLRSCNLNSQDIHQYRKYYDEHFQQGNAPEMVGTSIPEFRLLSNIGGGNVVVIDDFDKGDFADGILTVVPIDGIILVKSLSVKTWDIEIDGLVIGELQPGENLSIPVTVGQLITFRSADGIVKLVQVQES